MKHLLIIALCSAFSACSSSRYAIESDTGRVVRADYLDSLRGMASGNRDAEAMRFADSLIAQAGKRVATFDETTTGRVKVLRWRHRGEEKYTALREVVWNDGTVAWQGPQPPSGFYSAKVTTEMLP